MLNFTKMNGAGNDFVLLDNRAGAVVLEPAAIARICDRHRGVGADGILLVEPAQAGGDFRMRYYNSDGGEAEMCGNGARCFARFVDRLEPGSGEVSFETLAGMIRARFEGEIVHLQMSDPTRWRPPVFLDAAGLNFEVHSLNTGVPHAVVFAVELDNLPVENYGTALREHDHFAPAGTNVNFIEPVDAGFIAVRTYERGVEAETLACGTGVVASALVFHRVTRAPSPINVRVRSGEVLRVAFEGTAPDVHSVQLIGPADFVFDGTIDLP